MASINCKDLGEFQIIFELNCRLPTNSFASSQNVSDVCKDIKLKLSDVRKQRANLLQRCIKENQKVIADFRENPDRTEDVRTAHTNIRLLRNENTVDEIAIQNTDKIVYERCRKAELLS